MQRVAALVARAATARAALWVLVASTIANVFGYGYQVLMARLLRPDDYAILTALFGILILEQLSAQVIQSATARIAAQYRARGEDAALHVFVRRWTGRIFIGAGAPSLAIVLASPLIGGALALPRARTVLVESVGKTATFLAARHRTICPPTAMTNVAIATSAKSKGWASNTLLSPARSDR